MADEKRQEHKVDKSEWGPGPWQDEPDRLEWRTAAGLPAVIVRVPGSGHLCGYVAVPPGHPAHGKGYDDVDIGVHGGLTYANKCNGPVCHVPAPGEPDDVWWFGFDSAHVGDLSPGHAMAKRLLGLRSGDGTYRDVPYVRNECENLAAQLACWTGKA